MRDKIRKQFVLLLPLVILLQVTQVDQSYLAKRPLPDYFQDELNLDSFREGTYEDLRQTINKAKQKESVKDTWDKIDEDGDDEDKEETAVVSQEGVKDSIEKRALGITGVRILQAAFITGGVIHALALISATVRLSFDLYYQDHKCCGFYSSICSDYSLYKTSRDDALNLAKLSDVNFLNAENLQSWLLSQNIENQLLANAMNSINVEMNSLILAIDPDIERKLYNASMTLAAALLTLNATGTYSVVEPTLTQGILETFLLDVRQAAYFTRDYAMVDWMYTKLKSLKIAELNAGKQTPVLNKVVFVSPSRYPMTRWETVKTWVKSYVVPKMKFVVAGGAAITSAYAIVQDILHIIKTDSDCKQLSDDMSGVLTKMQTIQLENKGVYDDVTGLEANITEQYAGIRQSLYSDDFKAYTDAVLNMITNSSSTSAIFATAVVNINNFNSQIVSADKSTALALVESLTNTMNSISQKFVCQTEQFNALNYATLLCTEGSQSVLYDIVHARELSITGVCPESVYLTAAKVTEYVTQKMVAASLQSDCVLNNVNIKALTCTNWVNGIANAANAVAVGITEAQVSYFVDTVGCPLGSLSSVEASGICGYKDEDKTIAQVLVIYARFLVASVTTAYDECELTTSRKTLICQDKLYAYSSAEVVALNSVYPSAKITAAYDACVITVPSNVENVICRKKLLGVAITDSYLAYFIAVYGNSSIETIYNNCPAASGDTMEIGSIKSEKSLTSDERKSDEVINDQLLPSIDHETKSYDVMSNQMRLTMKEKRIVCQIRYHSALHSGHNHLHNFIAKYNKELIKKVWHECKKEDMKKRDVSEILESEKESLLNKDEENDLENLLEKTM